MYSYCARKEYFLQFKVTVHYIQRHIKCRRTQHLFTLTMRALHCIPASGNLTFQNTAHYLYQQLTLNFWVPDDRANEFECLCSSFLHLHMRVTQHFNQLRHYAWQTGGQLFGSTVCHCSQQLHRT